MTIVYLWPYVRKLAHLNNNTSTSYTKVEAHNMQARKSVDLSTQPSLRRILLNELCHLHFIDSLARNIIIYAALLFLSRTEKSDVKTAKSNLYYMICHHVCQVFASLNGKTTSILYSQTTYIDITRIGFPHRLCPLHCFV